MARGAAPRLFEEGETRGNLDSLWGVHEEAGTTMKLLIVDDEKDALEGMELYFSTQGHEVLTAQGGHEALALIRACKPDLMLLDLKMKGLSGFQIMEQVKTLSPGLATIVVTGISQDNLDVECERLGAAKVLRKPIRVEDLEEVLRWITSTGVPSKAVPLPHGDPTLGKEAPRRSR